MFYLGLFPSPLLRLAGEVVGMLWQGRHRFSKLDYLLLFRQIRPMLTHE